MLIAEHTRIIGQVIALFRKHVFKELAFIEDFLKVCACKLGSKKLNAQEALSHTPFT